MAGRMTHNQMLHLYQCRLNEMLYLRAAFCFEKRLQNFSSSIHKAQLGSPAVVKKKKKAASKACVRRNSSHITNSSQTWHKESFDLQTRNQYWVPHEDEPPLQQSMSLKICDHATSLNQIAEPSSVLTSELVNLNWQSGRQTRTQTGTVSWQCQSINSLWWVGTRHKGGEPLIECVWWAGLPKGWLLDKHGPIIADEQFNDGTLCVPGTHLV